MNWDSKLFALHLSTRRFGRQEKFFPEVDSTNRWMIENWREFTLPGAVVITEHQTSGRGRFRRKWSDEYGMSLLFSLLLFSSEPRIQNGYHQMLPAIALARVLKRQLRNEHKILLKWPNDVLLNNRKLSGILAERVSQDEGAITVVGMGINVNQQREHFPKDIQDTATSIAFETGRELQREILLAELLNEWEPLHDLLRANKTDELRKSWLEFGPAMGTRIVRREHGKDAEGAFEGIGEYGQLLLRNDQHELKEFFSGDILL